MFFSIIIPTFNSVKTIKLCIDSIINQTFADYEILLMDALSVDNTLSIIESYNDSRIKIYSEKDKGVYDAMNKGISKSKGEWLYFIGSDDILFDNNILFNIFSDIEKTDRIIYGNVLIKGETSWAKDNQIYDGFFNLEKLLLKNICHQSIFYNKKVFENRKYNIQYKICADWDFCLYAYSKYKFKYTELTIAGFSGGGISSTSTDSFHKDKWSNILDYFDYNVLNKSFRRYHSVIYLEARKKHLLVIQLFYYLYARYISISVKSKK